ncbi:hypothetical protein [Zavarzinia sp. CC-PAN008]|uniref:hypothetical protein n=1 Tax=Zavarzinia sp. CC-PAN008 TaxID=3243332 RepID=UPI003F7480A4
MMKSLIASAALALALVTAGPALADSARHHNDRPNYERQGYGHHHWQPPRHAWNHHDRQRPHWRNRHHRPSWAHSYRAPPRGYVYVPRPYW